MMNIVFRRLAMPGLLLTLLAGCNAGNPNPPVFNMALSQPLLEFTLNAGQTTSGYVYYEYATGENIAGNTDSLAGVNIDTTGKTGLLTLAPPVNQIPGIYFLTIDAINTTNTSGIIAVVNVLPPGQPANPTLVNFPMGGNTTRRAVVTLFVARNEISATYAPELVTPAPALASPASEGVTVNGIYSTLNTGSNRPISRCLLLPCRAIPIRLRPATAIPTATVLPCSSMPRQRRPMTTPTRRIRK